MFDFDFGDLDEFKNVFLFVLGDFDYVLFLCTTFVVVILQLVEGKAWPKRFKLKPFALMFIWELSSGGRKQLHESNDE